LKNSTLIAFALLFVVVACNESKKKTASASKEGVTTTYYLIRHAEKDRSDPSNGNPELTPEGIERARKWAQYFENIKIDQIYSTDFSRTMQTAAYVASQKQVMIESYDPFDLYNENFKTLTKGSNVLVVGHSNTTPQFVNVIIEKDKYVDIPDDENGMLFMVTLANDTTNVQLFTVD